MTKPAQAPARVDPDKIQMAVRFKYAEPSLAWQAIADRMGVDQATLWRWRQSEQWEITFREVGAEVMSDLIPEAIEALRLAWKQGRATNAIDVLRGASLVANERVNLEHGGITIQLIPKADPAVAASNGSGPVHVSSNGAGGGNGIR
jgi:uncharacterized protein YjcR